jgi:hypothetical protein
VIFTNLRRLARCLECVQQTPSCLAKRVVERNENMLTNPSRLLDIDDFIENLWKVHVQVKSEGYVQVSLRELLT